MTKRRGSRNSRKRTNMNQLNSEIPIQEFIEAVDRIPSPAIQPQPETREERYNRQVRRSVEVEVNNAKIREAKIEQARFIKQDGRVKYARRALNRHKARKPKKEHRPKFRYIEGGGVFGPSGTSIRGGSIVTHAVSVDDVFIQDTTIVMVGPSRKHSKGLEGLNASGPSNPFSGSFAIVTDGITLEPYGHKGCPPLAIEAYRPEDSGNS